ncbi:MAG: alpha/beta hydrolase [Legionella sp.]|nr:MAG: alpha/beta hydrolase [Legionella sp.]
MPNNTDHFKKIIKLTADHPFEVEFTGNPLAKTAVVLVHGFGVTRQSRGLFVDIESNCFATILSVRAEYSQVLKDRCIALPFPLQRQRLNQVIHYIKENYSIDNFIFIGHSQGCITLALEQPSQAKIVLLAPPIISPFAEFIKTQGWKNPGSNLNLQGDSLLLRSDLLIEVPREFWTEFKTIDASALYSDLALHNEVHMVFAGQDQVLGAQQPLAQIPSFTIAEANHDFSSTSRGELLSLISRMVK